MKALEMWLLGYLVNSLWQVPVLFVAAWMTARLVRRAGPSLEHRVWVGALLLEGTLPACYLRVNELAQQLWGLALRGWSGATPGGEVRVVVGPGEISGAGMLRLTEGMIAAIVVLYGCTVLYFAGRLGWGLWQTGIMRRYATPMTLSEETARMWARCSALFAVEGAQVAESPRTAGPVTLGVRRRVLLLPVGFLHRVTANDLEAVFAHECAHMRRHDFAKNLLYSLLTLPVAWHPAVWLTRSRLTESREMVCDAMAAEAVSGREGYARSLLRLAELLVQGTPARTLHAIGIFDANIFERRVMNLTGKRVEMKGMRRVAMAAVCVAVGLATCASALALRMEVGAPMAQSVQTTAEPATGAKAPAKVSGGVMAGNALTKVPPIYPPEAKEAKITGAVVLKAIISKDGVVENLQVVSGPEKLRRSALDSVRQWTYKPYLLNGQPVDVETTVTVTYSLQP